jgi:hypothetical protein
VKTVSAEIYGQNLISVTIKFVIMILCGFKLPTAINDYTLLLGVKNVHSLRKRNYPKTFWPKWSFVKMDP